MPVAMACTVGCGGNEIDNAPSALTVVDSAGVLVVDLPRVADITGPRLRTVPSARTSSQFGRVTDVVWWGDTLAVADAHSRSITLFDTLGSPLGELGREGQGPGEFFEPTWIGTHAGFLVAFDRALSRYTYFGGSRLETKQVRRESMVVDLLPLVVLDSTSFLVTHGEDRRGFRTSGGGRYRDTVPVFAMNSLTLERDTLGRVMGDEHYFVRLANGMARVSVGLGGQLLVSSNGRYALVGSNVPMEAKVFEGARQTMQLWSSHPRRGLDEGQLKALMEWRRSSVPFQAPGFREAWMDAPIADSMPSWSRALVTRNGSVWLGDYALPGKEDRRWVVLNHLGTVCAVGSLPAGWSLKDLQGDLLAVLSKGQHDEDIVEIHRVQIPGPC